ncbi:hypothetical protein BGZ49_000604 [Haplosporangium sp. Z 27]|nr:hypothetical protein BGZ49_000604 [Haplosporangium sp. Z 27]
MNDEVLGITSTNHQLIDRDSSVIDLDNQGYVSSTKSTVTRVLTPALSPRSKHLYKKLENLKRQLRSTASLEEEGVGVEEESILEEGPLSLDLDVIEKKRKWWLEFQRGKSTSLEENTTREEETDLQISRILSSETLNNLILEVEADGRAHEIPGVELQEEGYDCQEKAQILEEWHELSTIELNAPPMVQVEGSSDYHSKAGAKFDIVPATSVSNGYLSSSPDSISNSRSIELYISGPTTNPGSASVASMPSPDPSVHSISSPAQSQYNSELKATIKDLEASLPSPETQIPSSPGHISIISDSSFDFSVGSLSNNVISSLPAIPSTPPRPKDLDINLGSSPSFTRYSNPIGFGPFNIQKPEGNIFAQLAWSPPLRPTRNLSRAYTEQHNGTGQQIDQQSILVSSTKRAASTLVVEEDKEVIVIESSDDDDDKTSNNYNALWGRRDNRLKRMKGAREGTLPNELDKSQNDSQDVNLLEYQELEFSGSNSFVI